MPDEAGNIAPVSSRTIFRFSIASQQPLGDLDISGCQGLGKGRPEKLITLTCVAGFSMLTPLAHTVFS